MIQDQDNILAKAVKFVILPHQVSTRWDSIRLNTFRRIVKEYWLHEFEAIPQRSRMDYLTPVLNKIEAFLADPILNAILTQPKSSFDVRQIMDDGKVEPGGLGPR